jgi:serpin B
VTPDCDLLRQYLDHRDEGAFAELTHRHLNLVYAATLRVANGDTALAEDATQAAFAELARKAHSLTRHATLAGWLHTTARYTALRGIRSEQRRRAREQEASAMNDATDTTAPDAAWTQLRPLLDEALNRLRDGDRAAVLLRFFEEKSYREVAGILGVSERAAQMRVERALEKLRAQFSRHGVTTTAALLATALGAHGSVAAPAGLAAIVVQKSLAQGLAAKVSAFTPRKLFLATVGGIAVVAVFFFIALQQAKTAGAISAVPPPAKPLPTIPSQSASTSTSMTTSPIISRGTLAAVIMATVPLATAQTNPPPPPPPSAPLLRAAAVAPATPSATAASAPAVPGPNSPLVQANNRFALDLFRQFGPKLNENAFFSPYSISTALAMTWTGAKGDTAAQMAKVLRLADLAASEVPADFAALQQAVARAQTLSGAQLSIANSLWAEQNPEHPFLPNFLDGALAKISAPVTPVDFVHQSAEAAAQINSWVEQKTNEKIKNLIHPDEVGPTTRLVLVNAIYFKGQWETPFRPQMNTNSEFHAADGSAIPAVIMRQGMVTGYADITDGSVPCQVLSMHYGERNRPLSPGQGVSMVVILPRSPDDFGTLAKTLTAEQLAGWLGRLHTLLVSVYFPKFKLEERYQLADVLQTMGMRNAFVNPNAQPGGPATADFSGMDGSRDLYVSRVIHQTYVNVDENGAEAAAATAVGMRGGAAGPRTPPPEFRADHPFLFLIRDDVSGSILFLGQLANPAPLHETSPPPARGVFQAGPRGPGRGFRGATGRGAAPPSAANAPATSSAPYPPPPAGQP